MNNLTIIFLVAIFILMFIIQYLWRQRDALLKLTLQQKYERLAVYEMLNRLSESISTNIDVENSLRVINEYLVNLTQASAGAIYLLDEENKTLSARVVIGLFPPLHQSIDYVLTKKKYLERAVKQDKIKLGESIIGQVAESGESMLITDGVNDSRIPETVHSLVPVENLIITPLKIHDRIFGVFCVINKRNEQVFNTADLDLLHAISSQAATIVEVVQLYDQVAEQTRLEQELKLAHHFQQMLLPKELPDAPGIEFAAMSQSALEVGGDFYDFIWIDHNRLGLVIADVVGKGIPGALIMSMSRSVIRAQSQYTKNPMDVMVEVNRRFLQDTEDKVFITMIYAIIDFKSATMSFCRAGQDPIIVCSEDSSVHIYSPNGIALGLMEEGLENLFEVKEVPLRDGDTIIIHTDGVVEAMNEKDEEYGRNRMVDILQSHRKLAATDIQDKLLVDIKDFVGGASQHDDITMILFKVNDVAKIKEHAQAKVIDMHAN